MLSLICTLAVICSTLLPFMPAVQTAQAADDAPLLSNLIIDNVYQMTPAGTVPDGVKTNDIGFAPEITEYNGTAYRSVDKIQVYPFTESDSATVTVNGNALNSDGYYPIDVSSIGTYDIEVQVSDNGSTTTYTVHVEKVDSDYRGRRPVVENEDILNKMTVQSDFAEDTTALMDILKKDYEVTLPETKEVNTYVETDESYWSVDGSNLPNDPEGEYGVFTIDLGDVYSVSRIRAIFGPSNMNIKQGQAKISVSTDGVSWESPITTGNMNTGTQWHQNVTRYEFGVSHDARYIRFDVASWQSSAMELRLYQFMVFYDAGGAPEEQPAPEGGSVAHQHEERHQYLAGGQATVIEKGLTISGWTPSSGYGRGVPTPEESDLFGYDGPLFYDPDFENPDYMLYNPDALWGISKAPFGGNNMVSAGEPRDFIPESMKPYLSNAVSFCFGDEGEYSTAEAEAYGKWFEWTRQHYPGVILHTNQQPFQWNNRNQLNEYLRVAQPDMLVWDDYYGDQSYARPSSINIGLEEIQRDAARRLLVSHTKWPLYREFAYGGIDGTGAKPILFGQYLDAFAFNKPQSAKNLIVNASILSGAKWLNFFRVEYQFDRAYLFDEDGAPTRGLLEWGEIIDRVHAVDDQLTRLNSDWIMFKVGEMGSESNASADGFRSGNFDDAESAEKNQEFGIADVEMTSLSDTHNGQTGDVVLGYFNTLTGLYESEIQEYFAGATAPKAFMVLNGLIAGKDEYYNKFDIPAREAGSSDNTRQQITITADAGFAADHTLYMVDKDDRDENGNGTIKKVALDENNSFTVTLGGGEANLYFWDTDTTASANSAGEGTYASFAFDISDETYWQPTEAAADGTYTIENTFDLCILEQITLVEKGDAVNAFEVEYMDEDGSWQSFGNGTNIGGALDVSPLTPVTAQGVRITVTDASALPAFYSIETKTSAIGSEGQENTITVNDNTLGDGLFRFNYDDLWAYRETETNASPMGAHYPLEYDGHFSNWEGAEASFKFYGTGVTLHVRANQAAYIKAAVYDETGENMVSSDWITGTNGQRDIIFDNLSNTNAVYTLKIQKTSDSQAGIDGATVTYNGALSEAMLGQQSQGASAVQEYVNQRITDSTAKNYFTYTPGMESKNMGAVSGNEPFNTDSREASQWVEFVQDANYQNLGFTRTQADGASYTLNFYGTGVTLYSGVVPLGESGEYGELIFTLDGEPVTAESLVPETPGTNGKLSAAMWKVSVPDASENENHTLTVTVSGGYSRIDYAVVDRFWESTDSSLTAYTVTATAGQHGTISLPNVSQVSKGGNIVAQITPDNGYQTKTILVNNVSVPIPDDGRLVITNVQKNTTISVTFDAAMYDITISSEMVGGTLSPDAFLATAGTTITVTPEIFSGYEFTEGSVTVTAGDGTTVAVSDTEGRYSFTMPASDVTISAAFASFPSTEVNTDALEAAIERAEKLTETDYTPESYGAVKTALDEAQKVLSNADASQSDIDNAAQKLNDAIDNLVSVPEPEPEPVDKSELEKLIAETEQIDLTKYTDETAQAVKDALADARTVLEDQDASQQDVEDAVNQINTARDQLVPLPLSEEEDKQENNGQTGNTSGGAVATGDSTPIILAAFMMLLSLFTGILMFRKSMHR